MAGEVVERGKPGKKKGLRRPKRRVSIRIDMTPMVDIAFLLLIFYMVTTVFAMPQAMEINLPPKDQEEEIEVKESNLMTIRVDEAGRFWWNLKTPTADNLPNLLPSLKTNDTAYVLNSDTLIGLLREQNTLNAKLSTLILIHRDGDYADFVNILDDIDVLERKWNAYTANQKNIKVEDLAKADRFSYRYAVGKWESKDDKIIASALQKARERGEI
jgi:biopolymer transport protein ExbD